MKKIKLLPIILVVLAISAPLFAQNVLYVKSSQFTNPLIEKWADEYSKVNPGVQFKIADNKTAASNIALRLVVSGQDENKKLEEQTTLVGRYAILPIIGKNNPLLAELSKKKLNNKRFKELYFEKDLAEDDSKPSKLSEALTVYSGNNDASIAHSFAAFFGFSSSNLKGKRISGDDTFLINAIQRDNTGISFNALSNVFDIETRKLKKDIAILPLDVNKEYLEYFAESASIDDVVKLLENQSLNLIPVNELGFTYQSGDNVVKEFLAWILSEGQSYNNNYGVLSLDKKNLALQQKQLEEKLYASTNIE